MGLGWIIKYVKTSGMFTDKDLPNFHEVNEADIKLYRGAMPTAKGVADLNKMGVKTIITLMDDHPDKVKELTDAVDGLHMYQWVIPVSDKEPPTREQIGTFFTLVTSEPKPVFVHCNGGRHRTGLFIAMYRCIIGGHPKDMAWREAEKKGFYSENGHKPLKEFFFDAFDPSL